MSRPILCRRWLQFSLRGTIVAATVASLGLAWAGQKIRAYEREQLALASILKPPVPQLAQPTGSPHVQIPVFC